MDGAGEGSLMLNYVFKRLLGLIPTLLIVAVLVFLFVHLLPGDPARLIAGPEADAEVIELVRQQFNPDLDIAGILLTMYDGRTNLAKQVAEEVRNYFGDKVYETVIPRTVRLSEAPSYGQAIIDFDPRSVGAQVYTELAQEVLKQYGN